MTVIPLLVVLAMQTSRYHPAIVVISLSLDPELECLRI